MHNLKFESFRWINLPSLMYVCLSLLIGCADVAKEENQLTVKEITKTNKIIVYKFYKAKSAGLIQGQKMIEYIKAFDKIYAENDVTVIGTWYNVDDESETYFITGFTSEQHYTDFVEKMKTNEDYQRMSREMEPDRLSIESATLKKYFED